MLYAIITYLGRYLFLKSCFVDLRKQYYITVYVVANIGGLFLPHDAATNDILYDWTDSRKNLLTFGENGTKANMYLQFW